MPGDVNAISPVVGKIMETVRDMGCGAEHEFEIELALRDFEVVKARVLAVLSLATCPW